MTTRNFSVKNGLTVGSATIDAATGNANLGNVGTAQVLATANITAPQLISNIATGTAPLVVASTTLVANLNANALQGNTPATAATANTIAQRDANGNITANYLIGNGNLSTLTVSGTSNLGAVGNVTITGGSSGYYLQTNGSGGLSWAAVPSGNGIANGSSNVTIPTSSGNVLIYVNSNNTATFTATGANISGTANVSGNANVGNIGATQGIFTTSANIPLINSGTSNITLASGANVSTYIGGNSTAQFVVAATGVNVAGYANILGNANVGNIGGGTAIFTTGNITTINSGLLQNGTSNITITSGGNIAQYVGGNATSQLTVTATGANIAGYANILGNANVGNLGTAQVLASANITTPQFISNVATGTAPFVVSSTTQVANLNVATAGTAGSATNAAAVQTNTSTSSTVYLAGVTSSGNGNSALNIVTGITANFASNNITATSFTGALVNGNSNVNIPAANGNVNLSAGGTANVLVVTSTGANITGTANISGNANVGNLGTGGLITATGNVTGGNLVTGGVLTVSGTGISSIAGNLNMNNQYINNLATPVLSTDAASKSYVDNQIAAGIDVHPSVAADSQTNLSATYVDGGTTPTWTTITTGDTIATGSAHGLAVNDVIVFGSTTNGITAGTAYFVAAVPTSTTIKITTTWSGAPITTLTNGTGLSITSRANSGVGATLTSTTNTTLTLNGYTLASSDRVLINGQTSGAQNGVYVVTQAGSGSLPWILTRASDANKYILGSANGLDTGAYFLVTKGTDAGSAYVLSTTGTIVIGTTSLTWAQFAQVQVYTAGTGLTLAANNQFSISNTTVTGASYGGASNIATFTVNNQGQLTAAANVAVVAPAGTLSGTTLNASVVNSSLTSVGTLTSLNVSGNANVGNIGAAAGVFTANVTAGNANVTGQLISTVATGTAPLVVSSTTQVANLNAATAGSATNAAAVLNNVQTSGTYYPTFISSTANANYALASNTAFSANLANGGLTATTFVGNVSATTVAGSLTTNAQPNITSVGLLTGLTVGNATANTIFGNGTITSTGLANVGSLNVQGTSNLGPASNVTITGGSSGQVLTWNTANTLQWASPSVGTSISNGTSNVNIPASGGNVNTSVGSTANVLVVTATGANISGTANVSGNANVGNIGATQGIFTTSANIPLINSGTSNITLASGANVSTYIGGNSTAQFVVASTGVNVAGYANILGNANVGNIGGGTAIFTTGNITTINSGLMQNGTSNVTITSGGNVSTFIGGNATAQLVVTATGANIPGTANIVGNANVGNLGAAAGVFTANITAGNVYANSGTIGAANLTGTLTTASQPNVTSLGTLTSLTVNGNTSANYSLLNNGIVSNRSNIAVTSTATVIDQFAPATFRVAKYIIMANATGANTGYQAAEVLLVQDGVNAFITIYGDVLSNTSPNADVIDITANINGVSGNVTLYAAANTTFGATANVNVVPLYIKP